MLANLPEYELCYPADNPRQLGEFLAREEHNMDDVLLTYLDLDKLAGRYMEEHPGQFADGAALTAAALSQSCCHVRPLPSGAILPEVSNVMFVTRATTLPSGIQR